MTIQVQRQWWLLLSHDTGNTVNNFVY